MIVASVDRDARSFVLFIDFPAKLITAWRFSGITLSVVDGIRKYNKNILIHLIKLFYQYCNWKEVNFMDFMLTKEQEQMREEVIRFARESLHSEKEMISEQEMWKRISEFGLLGVTVPEEYCGLGESYLTAAVVDEALGYACEDNGFIFAVNNHIWVGIMPVFLFGSETIKKRYVSRMVQGQWIGAVAITEADAGSDANAMQTTAWKTEDGYLLNGSKMFISNGTIADVFIIFAKTEQDGVTAFIVEKDFVGLTVGKDVERMGLSHCPMAEITLKNCTVPQENLLGKIGGGGMILKSVLEHERCFEFACHIGAMQRVMEKCLLYTRQRRQFGKYLSEFQAITHKISEMKMKIELARQMMYKVAWKMDHGKDSYLDSSIFKLFVSESYIKTCQDAIQIFGAYGYTTEYGLEQELRDAIACGIYSGTTEMQKNTIFSLSLLDI